MYNDYAKQKIVETISRLVAGLPSDILKDCITCAACNEYCPRGADPFDRINELQEQYNSLPVPEKLRAWMDAGKKVPSRIILGDKSKPTLSLCVVDATLPEDALDGRIFSDMTAVRGGDYFCHFGYVHLGKISPLRENAERFISELHSVGSDEIVFLHDDCYSMIKKAKEYGLKIPFKPVHLVEYVARYLRGNDQRIHPLSINVAYQRPCASRHSGELDPVLDEVFDMIGVKRVKRKYDRESALCCGSIFSRIYPEKIRPFQERNIQDALDSGCEAMVFLCPICMHSLSMPAKEKGLKPIFITQLIRMALGELPVTG
jgi:Fe-S oxidoreductase